MSAGSRSAPVIDLERLRALDKRSLGHAISLCEDERREASEERTRMISGMSAHPGRRRARLVGVTGPPGSGKSTLIAELAVRVVAARPGAAVAVLAVDPSSPTSGGAILGDRVRARFPPGDDRLFFRSQASERELGGLGRHTFAVCRLLQHLFDLVLVETVGVGQSEVDVGQLADRTYLMLPPHWGDAVQLMKAGILEIPDAVVLSKEDTRGPGDGSSLLEAAITSGTAGRTGRAVHRVSAHTGTGIDPLVAEITAVMAAAGPQQGGAPLDRREPDFFRRWVQGEFGRAGSSALERFGGGAAAYLDQVGGYDAAMTAFPRAYRAWMAD